MVNCFSYVFTITECFFLIKKLSKTGYENAFDMQMLKLGYCKTDW